MCIAKYIKNSRLKGTVRQQRKSDGNRKTSDQSIESFNELSEITTKCYGHFQCEYEWLHLNLQNIV